MRRQILQNKDVIITTPTSSGKSIAFNVPVFETLLTAPRAATALFLFPLNALASDQQEKLVFLNSKLPAESRLRIQILSSAVKISERERTMAEEVPDIIITNPDIIHHQLAKYREPSWKNWREFLRRLRIVVIDEAHQNIGVFGTNVANMVRRLYCIMNSIQPGVHSRLRFIIASATVGNATELAQRILSRKSIHRLAWIKESGAAAFERVTLCLAAESNPKLTVSKLIDLVVKQGMNGIVFVNTIRSAYDLLDFMQSYQDGKAAPGQQKPFMQAKSVSRIYTASVPKKTKDGILSEFKSGRCRIVISTNALEAGVRGLFFAIRARSYLGSCLFRLIFRTWRFAL